MRKILVLLFSCIATSTFAQFSSPIPSKNNGVTIGLKKNYSAFIEYGWKSGFYMGAKHTVIADRVDYQSFRFVCGYGWTTPYVQFSISPFATSDWKSSFWNMGASLNVSCECFSGHVSMGAEYLPYYDSALDWQSGWALSGAVNLTKELSLIAEYSRRPDYRIAYRRVYVGASFHVSNLVVAPMVEFPLYDAGFHASHSSVIVSMAYRFITN